MAGGSQLASATDERKNGKFRLLPINIQHDSPHGFQHVPPTVPPPLQVPHDPTHPLLRRNIPQLRRSAAGKLLHLSERVHPGIYEFLINRKLSHTPLDAASKQIAQQP